MRGKCRSSCSGRLDVLELRQVIHPEEAIALGADAIAVSMFVKGSYEVEAIRMLADTVKKAWVLGLPVITHVYPRKYRDDGTPYISSEPEDLAWAVRCGVEAGADVVKVGYTGDVASFRQIVGECPVPIVAAGGPKTNTLQEALEAMKSVVEAGTSGATTGLLTTHSPKRPLFTI